MWYDRPLYAPAGHPARLRTSFVALLVGSLTLGTLAGCLDLEPPTSDPESPSYARGSSSASEGAELFLVELVSVRPDPAAAARGLGSGLDPKWGAWRLEHYAGLKAQAHARAGGVIVRELSSLPIAVVAGDGAVRAAWESDPAVLAIHDDARLRRTASNLDLVGAPAAHAAGADGAGTAVAVIDSGLDYTRAAFGSCTSPGVPQGCRVVYAVDVAADDGVLDDDILHGTNVAGVVAQLAPAVDLLAFDVFDGEHARVSDILWTINWLIQNGAARRVVAANLSLGGEVGYPGPCATSVFAPALDHLRQAGIVPVVSAGNDAFANALTEPACAPAALSVGAVYPDALRLAAYGHCFDSLPAVDSVTCFSNSADMLGLLAPGVGITAAGITMSGTSQAAPHVAGAVAAYVGESPGLTADALEAALKTHGAAVVDSRSGRVVPRLDLGAAIAALAPAPLADPCPFLLTLDLAEVAAEGAVGTLTIDTPSGCSWSAEADVDWIRLADSGAELTGEGPTSVTVLILGNHGPQRHGQVSVGEDPHPVVQAAGSPLGDAWVLIDGDAPVTSRRGVTLHIGARISGQEPASMCVSNGSSCQAWEPFRAARVWLLPAGAGEKSVKVWFMRGDGAIGALVPLGAVLASDSIELDPEL